MSFVSQMDGARAPVSSPFSESSMSNLISAVRNFVRNEEGATTAEYGIIVVVMAAIALAVLLTFRTSINTLYNDANTTINNATTIS